MNPRYSTFFFKLGTVLVVVNHMILMGYWFTRMMNLIVFARI